MFLLDSIKTRNMYIYKKKSKREIIKSHSNLLRKILFKEDYKYYHQTSMSAFVLFSSVMVIRYNILIPLYFNDKSDRHLITPS